MNVLQNTQNMLREQLQNEIREFQTFCADQGIQRSIADTMAMNQCFVGAACIAEQTFGMGKATFLAQASLIWDQTQEAKAKGKDNG